jgi:hypothetical protein
MLIQVFSAQTSVHTLSKKANILSIFSANIFRKIITLILNLGPGSGLHFLDALDELLVRELGGLLHLKLQARPLHLGLGVEQSLVEILTPRLTC